MIIIIMIIIKIILIIIILMTNNSNNDNNNFKLTVYLTPVRSMSSFCTAPLSFSKNSCALSVGSPSPYVATQKMASELSIVRSDGRCSIS